MSISRFALIGIAALTLLGAQTEVVDPAKGNLPNPNPKVVKNWALLPDSRTWGSTAGVDIGPDGQVWAYDRCGAVGLDGGCDTSQVAPNLEFDRSTAKVLKSFGAGLFVLPHGIHVDREGNVWVTDSQGNKVGTKGHQVIKFSPEGKVLMKLGKPGVAGSGPDTFNEPCDVITAPNGDIFVADGHSGQNDNPPPGSTGRIMKFTKDGKFIKEWGKLGPGPGEFRNAHALALDSRGRVFLGDRGNARLQIFDADGKFIAEWKQFGRPSGLYIDKDDKLYVIDADSSAANNPGWKKGIRIGSARDGTVVAFVPGHQTDNPEGAAGEGIVADPAGHLYAAENTLRGLTKYAKQ